MITLLFARYLYLNPGQPTLLSALERSPAKGFRAIDVTPLAPDRIRELVRESDGIVIDQSIENAATWAQTDSFGIYHILGQRPAAFYQEVLGEALAADAARLFLSNFDLHDARIPATLDRFAGRVHGIAWMFEKLPRRFAEVPPAYRDAWMTEPDLAIENWERIRRTFPSRIELVFSVGPEETEPPGGATRWDACVAGANYATRRIARQAMRAEGLRLAPYAAVDLTARAGHRVLPHAVGTGLLSARRASAAMIAYQQRLQRALVRRSRVNFVDGSGVAYATRKYFEIPAAGRAMVAYPSIGFEDYGFVDGVNAIATLPEDAGRATRALLAAPSRLDAIARRGAEMVRTLHSVERRATDLVECFRRLVAGRLGVAQFVGGQFELA